MTTPRPAAAALVSPAGLSPRRRLLGAATVAGAGALLLSGCAVLSPVQTNQPYEPGDGVAITMGDVDVDGLVIVADTKGGPGTLIGHVINGSDSAVELAFATGGGQPATASVPANGTLSLSTGGAPVVLAPVTVPPGGMTDLVITTPQTGQNQVSVPVLDAVGAYADLAPSPSPTAS
ncbi:MAG TPA: hypothetical protein VES95_10020 [Dermatophilaceae bacterium]|nr:hypothetical protein [Dermatophilaceae bacterium]